MENKGEYITEQELCRYSKFMRKVYKASNELYKLAIQDNDHLSLLVIAVDSSEPGHRVWRRSTAGNHLCKDAAQAFTCDDFGRNILDKIFDEAESMLDPGLIKVRPLDRKTTNNKTSDKDYYEAWRGACDVIESLNEEKRMIIRENRLLKEQLDKYRSACKEIEKWLHGTRRVEQ